MKFFSTHHLASVISALSLAGTAAYGLPSPTQVSYAPASKVVQGNQALTSSYVLSVTSPNASQYFATPVATTVTFTVLSAPTGVTNAQALPFVSASPATLTFTAPNQTLTTTISINVPLGNYAGNYAYQINTAGWPSGVTDGPSGLGATINANISPPLVTGYPPTVTLTSPADDSTYTYNASQASSVTIPIAFTAVVSTGNLPLTQLLATVSGPTGASIPVSSLVTSGIGLLTGSGSASFTATASGVYTVTVEAVNAIGLSTASATVTVSVTAPPPTIVATNPTTTTYAYTLGGPAISVPVGCVGTSLSGNITSLTAALVGISGASTPVTLTTTGVNSATTATGTGSLSISAAGTYTLTYTTTNAYGSASTTVAFTVNGVYPVPTIVITSPANNATFQVPAGGTSVSVPYTLAGGTTYGKITSVKGSLVGPGGPSTLPLNLTLTGLNTASISGSGTLTISAPGTYTLSFTDSNGQTTASASTTFTVTQAQAAPTETVTWLPPVANGQSICGGSVIPASFTVTENGALVADTSIVVAIYQVYANGTSSTPVIYTYTSKSCAWNACNGGGSWWWGGNNNGSCSNNNYGCGNWNSAGWNACTTYYTITSSTKAYQLYFPTDAGANTYVIQVYKQLSSNPQNLQLLATTQVVTQKCGTCYDNNGNQCQGQDDNNGNCVVSGKCWGNYTGGADSWGGNGSYGNSDGGGWTNNCGYNGSSSSNSVDNNSCLSSGWGR